MSKPAVVQNTLAKPAVAQNTLVKPVAVAGMVNKFAANKPSSGLASMLNKPSSGLTSMLNKPVAQSQAKEEW